MSAQLINSKLNYDFIDTKPIYINDCMSISLNEKSYIELFDNNAILYILEHKNKFKQYLKNPDIDQFGRLQDYYKKSINGRVNTHYSKKKKGYGRLFADNALSLQGLDKSIRGSIAGDLYWDIDMVNAHVVILKYICKIYDTDCPNLTKYVNNRDKIINKILEDNKEYDFVNKDYAKRMILSTLNGGNEMYEKLPVKCKWLKKYKKEIKNIHEEMSEDNWYPDITEVQLEIRKEKGKENFNLNGSILNKAICVYEDYLLGILTNYLEEQKIIKDVCVLCFDGIMVPKVNCDIRSHMDIVENIYSELGFEVKLKLKEFEKFPNLPKVIPKQIENDYTAENNYYWFDFQNEMTGNIWESLDDLLLQAKKKINKVMLHILSDGLYICKISDKDPNHIYPKIPVMVCSYKMWNLDGNYKICSITLENLLIKHALINSLDKYNNITFKPEGKVNEREFNTWVGFKSKRLEFDQIDLLKLEPVFDLLYKVWADSDKDIFEYILSWFHEAFKKPYIKNKVALILYSEDQQIGKGIFMNEFLIKYIYGERYGMSINGLSGITENFNKSLMNKLLVNCDELQSINSNSNYSATFDQLKKIITDPTITIKIKYAEAITNYPDYINVIASTNNVGCFKIERKDARYCSLKCSNCYTGNYDYFDNLINNVFNQDVANHFFSYCYYLDKFIKVKNIRNIPSTNLKTEMIINSSSSPKKFLYEIKNIRSGDEKFDEETWMGDVQTSDLIKAKTLFNYYKLFCEEENEKTLSNTRFGRDIKNYITKTKKSCIYYDLTSITI